MRNVFCSLLLLVFFQQAKSQSIVKSDSLQIFTIIDDWNKGWLDKDFILATNGYSKDAHFVNAFGDKRTGRAAIHDLLKEVFALPFVMAGQSETNNHQYQVLDEINVVVHTSVVRKGQQLPDGTVLPDRQTTHLRVFQKAAGRWEIKSHLISDARDKQIPKH